MEPTNKAQDQVEIVRPYGLASFSKPYKTLKSWRSENLQEPCTARRPTPIWCFWPCLQRSEALVFKPEYKHIIKAKKIDKKFPFPQEVHRPGSSELYEVDFFEVGPGIRELRSLFHSLFPAKLMLYCSEN